MRTELFPKVKVGDGARVIHAVQGKTHSCWDLGGFRGRAGADNDAVRVEQRDAVAAS